MSQRSRAMARLGPKLGTAVLAFACALPIPAFAMHPPDPDRPEPAARHLAFGAFFMESDAGRGVDYGLGTHYGLGRAFLTSRAWELRLFGGTLETGVSGRSDFYQYGVGVDVFQYFGNLSSGHPYAVLGLGGVLNDVDPDTADGASGYANGGIGWRSAPWAGWTLRHRFDLRAAYDTFDEGQLDVLLGLTLEIMPQRVVVQERLVERVVEVPAVVEDGDGDGIPDGTDQCPDTVSGAKVETDGCVRKEQVVVLPNIEFAYDRAELTAGGRQTLEQVVRFMNDQPEIQLEVWGHTDARGGDVYNLGLSQRRSAAVVQHLTTSGIAAARMKSAGFGESRPLADNGTEEGRERNRRVELHIRASRAGGK